MIWRGALLGLFLIGVTVAGLYLFGRLQDIDTAFVALTVLLTAVTLFRALRRNGTTALPSDDGQHFNGQPTVHLASAIKLSFKSGLVGGLLGGSVAGILIGIAYYMSLGVEFAFQPFVWVAAPIFLYSSLSGALAGLLVDLSISMSTTWPSRKSWTTKVLLSEPIAGAFGGMLAGIIIGVIGHWYFVQRIAYDVANPELIFVAVGLATIAFIVIYVAYDIHLGFSHIWQAALLSVVLCFFSSALVYVLGSMLGIIEYMKISFRYSGSLEIFTGGFLLGLILGAILGASIGKTVFLLRMAAGRSIK